MRTRRSLRSTAALAVAVWVVASAAPAQAEPLIGLSAFDDLVKFDSATPGMTGAPIPITGLQPNEQLCGIDFRPANGELYAVGSTSRIYTINTTTGAATQVGTPGTFALSGSVFGVDFDPVSDRLRLVSNTEQNLSITPGTGALDTTDGPLAYATGDANEGMNPGIVGLSYTNNVAGAASTAPYVIDASLDILARLNPAPSGTLWTVGPLGVDVGGNYGSDISGATGKAYGVNGGSLNSILLERNLDTGQATNIGSIPHPLRGLSVVPTAPGSAPTGQGGGSTGPGIGPAVGGFLRLRTAKAARFIPGTGTLRTDGVVIRARCPAAGTGPNAAGECFMKLFLALGGVQPGASQSGRSVVVARGTARLKGGQAKRVRAKLTRAGRKTVRRLRTKRVRGRLTAKVRYRQPGRADQRRTFKRNVMLRVRRPRR